jgi:hypothetical protein
MRHWHEDVVLVEEEMCCMIEYGYWPVCEWAQWAGARGGTVDNKLLEDLTAYTREQHICETTTCETLTAKWVKIHEKGQVYLAE